MDRLEQYAQWLVDNEDKKGTPDFETVAQAYRSIRSAPMRSSSTQPRVEEPSKERTWGEAAKDIGAGAVSGIGSLVQLPGQLYGLATGNFEKTGALGLGEDIQKYGEEMKSPGLKAREAARSAAVQEAEKTGQWEAFKTAVGETVSDPALLFSFLSEQAPQMIPAVISGGGTAALAASNVMAKAAARGISKEAAEKVAQKAAIKAGTTAGIQTGAVQQGADIGAGAYEMIYKELTDKGVAPEAAAAETINKARAAGASGYLLSLLAQKLPGGQAMERILAGEKMAGKGILPRLGTGLATGAKEIPGEMLEETGGRFSQNLAMREVKPEQSLTEGLGETAAMAALGGAGMGGVTGALGRRAEAPAKPEVKPEAETTETTTEAKPEVTQEAKPPRVVPTGFEELTEEQAQELAKQEVKPTAPTGSLAELQQKIDALQEKINNRKIEIADMYAAGQQPRKGNHLYNAKNANERGEAELKAMQGALAQRIAAGEKDVVQPDQGTSGASVSVPAQPGTDVAAAPATGAPESSGVVSAGQNAPATAEGKGQPTAPVTEAAPATTPPPAAPARDELYDQVTKGLADGTLRPSASNLKRVFKIGDGRANKILDELQANNIVTPKDAKGLRAVVGKEKPAAEAKTAEDYFDSDEINGIFDSFTNQGDKPLASRGPLKAENVEDPRIQQLYKAAKQVGVSPVAGETPQQLAGRAKRELQFRKETEQETAIPGGKQVKLTTPLSAVPIQELAQQGIQPRKTEAPARDIIPENQRKLYDEMAEEFNAQLNADIAAQKERGGEQADDRTEDEKLPAFDDLTDDEVDDYFSQIKKNSWEEHTAAAQNLSDRVSEKRRGGEFAGRRAVAKAKQRGVTDEAKQEEIRAKAKAREAAEQKSARDYNRERGPMSDKTGLAYTFPIWGDLSQEAQDLYIATIGSGSAAEQFVTFGLLKRQIQAELLAKSKSEASLAAINEQIRVALQEEDRKRKRDTRARSGRLPKNIQEKMFSGDLQGLLDYFKDGAQSIAEQIGKPFQWMTGTGISLPRTAREGVHKAVYQNLATELASLPDFKVNIVFDPNLNKDEVAVYDYKTNTVYVGPNGLTQGAILHELTHAATVKIIHAYYTNKESLTPRARESVEQLIKIKALAEPKLKSKEDGRYAHAFDNLYEFVAYAMTDPDFQRELMQMQAPSVAKATARDVNLEEAARAGDKSVGDNLWGYFVNTLAHLYRLFRPLSQFKKYLAPFDRDMKVKSGRYQNVKTTITKYDRDEGFHGYKYEDSKEEARRKYDAFMSKLYELRKPQAEREAEAATEDDHVLEKATEKEKFQLTPELEARIAAFELEKQRLLEEDKDAYVETISQLFDDIEAETEQAEKQTKDFQKQLVDLPEHGIKNLEVLTLREPGYRGNFMLEAAAAFEGILAAPSPEGMPTLAGRMQEGALPAKTAPQTKQAEKKREDVSFDDAVAKQQKRLPETNTVGAIRKLFTTAPGQRSLVTAWQNDRYAIKFWEDSLERANKIVHAGKDKMNNIYTQIALSAARAKDIFLTKVETPAAELREAIGKFADAMNLSTEEALSYLQVYAIGLHEPERREAKFLLNVPLNDKVKIKFDGKAMTPADVRQYILDEYILNGAANKQEAAQLKKVMRTLVDKYKDATGSSPSGEKSIDEFSENYNVIGTYSAASIKSFQEQYKKNEKVAKPVFDALQKLQKVTAEMNRDANYWSKPVESLVNFYGWENYVPFKGKSEAAVGKLDYLLDFDSERLGKELQDAPHSFEGRVSESDNSIVQTMTDATRAAMRAGRADLTLSIKNAIQQKLIRGDVVKTIAFKDRYNAGIDEEKKRSTIFHYNEDGSVDVLYIQDRSQLEAIRRTYQQSNPLIDMLNGITSKLGQVHTRYNIAFAPMNYFRDMLTNAFTIGTEMGTADAARYIGSVTASVVNGGLYRAFNVARLYNTGNIDEIKRLAGGSKPRNQLSNKELKYRDMYEYIRQGGMVSYLQGLSSQGTFTSLQKDINSTDAKKAATAINKVFDIYTDMFELASRSAAYSITKSSYMQGDKKLSEAEAATRAAGYVKGLANFEQVGKYGKAAGAMFMFFRPAATGAVRALETLSPMLRSTDDAVAEFEANNPEAAKDKKAVEAFRKNYEKQKKAATYMTLALTGMGALVYMMAMAMSDDDDLGRNRIATDDINRWTRYARFYIPGFEKPIQLPWGFGLGAFASSGAQMAALASGTASVKDVFNNIIEAGMDSFLPLPQSRINKFDQPAAWLMDSATPSVLRPFFEWQMNIDALGREIYNNRNTRVGDAYTGGDSIPEIWKMAARTMAQVTNGSVDVSPNTLYFFASNYGDGAARLAQTFGNWALLAQGEKEFNPKHDTLLFDSFFGAPSNFDAREFSAVEKQIQEMEKRLKMFKDDPAMEARYIASNPMAEHLVDVYNKGVNADLKELRTEANEVRAMQISPKAKEAMLKNIIRAQNLEKRFLIEEFKAYGVKP